MLFIKKEVVDVAVEFSRSFERGVHFEGFLQFFVGFDRLFHAVETGGTQLV